MRIEIKGFSGVTLLDGRKLSIVLENVFQKLQFILHRRPFTIIKGQKKVLMELRVVIHFLTFVLKSIG